MAEGTNLPPGFRFFPSDEDLVVHFLYRKAALLPCYPDIIPTIDIHHCDPWDLNGKALQGGDNYWYFFACKTEKRSTANGYWHVISTDETVTSGYKNVGIMKTLKYYLGEHPEGVKTNWLMNEYHLLDGVTGHNNNSVSSNSNSSRRKRGQPRLDTNKWILCRVYESTSGSSHPFSHEDEGELSCLDEVFLSLDDYDEANDVINYNPPKEVMYGITPNVLNLQSIT